MSSVPIPENPFLLSPFFSLTPFYMDPRGDFLNWLFDKLPQAHKSVSEGELLELKRLLEDLKEKPQLPQDPRSENPARGTLYQELLPILREVYKDPRNPIYAPLLRFIGERKVLMQEILAAVFSEKLFNPGEKSLGSVAARIIEWQVQYQEGTFPFLLGEKILSAIHRGEIATLADLKPWVEVHLTQNSLNLSTKELQSLLAILGIEKTPLKEPLLLGQIHEKTILYLNEPFLSLEEKEFFQTSILPYLEQAISEELYFPATREESLPAMLREESAGLLREGKAYSEVSEKTIERYFDSLSFSLHLSKEEIQNLFRQIPRMLEFPIIGPYLSSLPFSPSFSKDRARFRKPSCTEVFEEDPFEEPWDDDEEEEEDDEEEEDSLTFSS